MRDSGIKPASGKASGRIEPMVETQGFAAQQLGDIENNKVGRWLISLFGFDYWRGKKG